MAAAPERPALATRRFANQADQMRQAQAWVTAVVAELDLPPERGERLLSAVVGALGNLRERGGSSLTAVPVVIQIALADGAHTEQPEPDVARGPRGWGFFVVERPAEAQLGSEAASQHLIEIVLYREGDAPPAQTLTALEDLL
jgi:hypothetical protein